MDTSRIRLAGAVLALGCGFAAGPALAPAAEAARPLATGFFDPVFNDPDAATVGDWMDKTREANGVVVRVHVVWRAVAPAVPPAGFQAGDPADPAYDWTLVDQAVRAAAARGLDVILSVASAPNWAEAPGGSGDGTWRPDPAAFADFMRAAARRYSGVRRWQVWNEPNLSTHLSPQEEGGKLVSPGIFRRLLNAAYAALKSVDTRNVVSTGGTAPYGDRTGRRTAPVRFLRDLLCLRGRALRPVACPDPARFDVLAHHPYAVDGPRRKAYGADDAAVSDLGKLTRVLRKARRSGRVLPRGRKSLWVTEVSWDSAPPDPDGVPARRHAAWLADALYVLWRQGVDTITWFHVRDDAPVPSFGTTYQSGVYFRDGRRKPAWRAFRFPFTVASAGNGRALVWGKAPRTGVVSVQRRAGGRWTTVARVRVRGSGVFLRRVRADSRTRVRARIGPERSLSRPVG